MAPGGVENGAIELAVLKIPYMDPEIVSLALLEVILVRTQVNPSDSSYKPRAWEVSVLI